MYQFPSTTLLPPNQADLFADSASHDEDDLLDAWLGSLSVSELESVLDHLMDHPGHALTDLDSTA